MGRPPCCDKAGVKKGPWTPEEDIILVSYIQEHGPGNWRAVPSNTGLLRCSKSCRLRWTNYLRPGIKRGNFTDQEEKMIIHLQALLGNRWAAIASYLPQRTDNDIKNYWNTHLRKKLKKLQSSGDHDDFDHHDASNSSSPSISRGQWERRLQTDINTARQALCDALSPNNNPPISFNNNNNNMNFSASKPSCNDDVPKPTQTQSQASCYASSADNIARLLKGWMKNKNPPNSSNNKSNKSKTNKSSLGDSNNNQVTISTSASSSEETMMSINYNNNIDLSNNNNINNNGFDQSMMFGTLVESLESSNNSNDVFSRSMSPDETKADLGGLSLLEKWLFDEAASQDDHKDFLNGIISLDENNPHFF